jgi:formiminotetrahydrofolate cyclodeaminase
VMRGKMAAGGPSAGLRGGIEPFIEQLAAPTATPGGGSASAAAGAMAAALASMVAGMSRGKKNYVQYERELSQVLARLEHIREELKSAIDADAEAYKAVIQAFRRAKENGGASESIHDATRRAIEVPLRVAEQTDEVREIIGKLRGITNPKMASDLDVAEALARAAARGGVANVEINLDSPPDETFRSVYRGRAAELRQRNT